MNRILRFSLSTLLVLMVGCDAGMSIRQTSEIHNESSSKSELVLRIATTHQLIGETHYAPKVEMSNSGSSHLIVTGVELVTGGGILANHPRQSTSYPIELAAGDATTADVWFDLVESAQKVFKETVGFRVHYLSSGKEQSTVATLVGGPLSE